MVAIKKKILCIFSIILLQDLQIPAIKNVRKFAKAQAKKINQLKLYCIHKQGREVFENHSKSLIVQQFERNELIRVLFIKKDRVLGENWN